MPRASMAPRHRGPAHRGDHVGVHVGQEHPVEQGLARHPQPGVDGLHHRGGVAGDQHQVVAGLHRPGPQAGEGSPLDHGVAGDDAGGHRAELEKGESGIGAGAHTILNAPTTEMRRSRVKVSGRVMPSPEGLAMENEVKPSPPWPSPA